MKSGDSEGLTGLLDERVGTTDAETAAKPLIGAWRRRQECGGGRKRTKAPKRLN
jgi:hypothetical protein